MEYEDYDNGGDKNCVSGLMEWCSTFIRKTEETSGIDIGDGKVRG